MKVLIALIFFVGLVQTDVPGECSMASFYLELGCKAAPYDNMKCPESFICPDLHPDPKLCYYRGNPYNNRETLKQSVINNPCSTACECVTSPTPRFECAAVDCVETFDKDMKEICINTYDLDSCCSNGNVCGKDAVAALKICEIDGKEYKEGQMFQPKDTWKNCICTAQWNGSIDNPDYCRTINCGIEIHYQDKLLENCAPVFANNARSCPITFDCPTNTTQVVKGFNVRAVKSQCVYGNMTLTVGDEVTTQDKCMKCSCEVPPFVTCTKQTVCDA